MPTLEPSIFLSNASQIEQAALPLYAFPARAWHTHEYSGLLASEVGPSMAVISEPESAVAWSGATIGQLATRYAELIASREAGLRRPVALFGWSVGGVLALEVARQLEGRLSVAWVGVLDASTFPKLREQLALIPPLTDQERPPLQARLAQWLKRSDMGEAWRQLLDHMSSAQRDYFLREVGMYGDAMPTDGPQPDSQEHALWSRLNCLRLGLAHAPPKAMQAPVRWWRSEEMSTEPDELREAFVHDAAASGPVAVIPGCNHLSVLDAPEFHRLVAQALTQAPVQRGEETSPT